MTRPADHPSWTALTERQRRTVNEVWDEMVVPALEETAKLRRERDAAIIAAQDARARALRTSD